MQAAVLDVWQWVLPVAMVALIFWVASRAIISSYFRAKEGFVDRIVDKMKGSNNGKGP